LRLTEVEKALEKTRKTKSKDKENTMKKKKDKKKKSSGTESSGSSQGELPQVLCGRHSGPSPF
jgi:hypothetical protein